MGDPSGHANRVAATVVVLTAVAAGLPALWLPLLSDDWVNLGAVSDGVPWRTPFGYVRPVYLALFRLGRSLWGLSAWPYHAISLALFATCALLLFVLVRRLAGDRKLALAAAVVFALQPFSIESAAWPSSQADLLACLFALASLVAWDSWRASARPGALAAVVVCFLLALLSKESAVVIPPLIALIEWRLPRTTPRSRWVFAIVAALGLVTAAHILILRPHVLGVDGTALPPVSAKNVLGTAIGYVTATALPLPGEFLEMHRRSMALVAAAALAALAVSARLGAGRVPRIAWFGIATALVAVVPALVGFQERYFLMASAGVAVALVALVRACGRTARTALIVAGAVVWCASAGLQWAEWFAAGRASRALVAGLAREAADPTVREIVIANLPHRVRGVPVVTNLTTLVELVTGRKIPVALAARVDYVRSSEDGLDAADGPAVSRDGEDIVVHLRVPSGVYRRFVRPLVREGDNVATGGDGLVFRRDAERYTVRIPVRGSAGRSVLVWSAGSLLPATTLAP